MDFWSSLKVLLNRWYIVAVGLVLTATTAVGVNLLISPTYTASGSVVLSVPPNLPDRAESLNPFLAYGNLEVPAKVVASAMNQPSVVREQKAKGATGDFVVDLDPERSTPIITVDSTAPTAEQAIRTVKVVTAGVQQLLLDRQKALAAPQSTWITANQLVSPEEANQAIGSKLRALSAVAVIGIVATLSVAFAVEGWSVGRERQADAAPPAQPAQPEPAGPGPEPDDGEVDGWRRYVSKPVAPGPPPEPPMLRPAPPRRPLAPVSLRPAGPPPAGPARARPATVKPSAAGKTTTAAARKTTSVAHTPRARGPRPGPA